MSEIVPDYGFHKVFNGTGFECVPFEYGSPMPKLDIDKSIPTLTDMCSDQNKLDKQFLSTSGLNHMLLILCVDCNTFGLEISGVPIQTRNSIGNFYHIYEDDFFFFVYTRLKYVFNKEKNNQWVEQLARNMTNHMKEKQTSWFGIDEFIDKYMTPFIQRNYCTTDDSEDPKDREYVTVGAMYGKLHTFLCGTKRKQSAVSKLNSDIIAKIFDHMQISAYPDVKWNSFNSKLITA
jgi:hypothetical protein